MTAHRPVRLVYPHQLCEEQLDVPAGTRFLLVEDDLLFRQYAFHAHKLVLHRAAMGRFADRLRAAGHDADLLSCVGGEAAEPDGRGSTTTGRLADWLTEHRVDRVSVVDVTDDWLTRSVREATAAAGCPVGPDHVVESPLFLTSRAELRERLGDGTPRMQHFYQWQRRRLDVLLEDDEPVGGRWSFDSDNRRPLPTDQPVPEVAPPKRVDAVEQAVAWVSEHFPDAPGDPARFAWPTDADEAEAGLEDFLAGRFREFGPFEDAITVRSRTVFHSLLTPSLNTGLLSPGHVLARALEVGHAEGVPLASLEGFVRQVIGWREYMRAAYELWGRRLRTSNRLGHTRDLPPGWWTAETGLEPVDHVLRGVLETGYAHHIERLMVLGNALCLLRVHPDAVHAWFMALFVDAYDWVMVPNVYAMSQYAAGSALTTKPYVSGSNYLRKMSDLPPGDWHAAWDGLYWTFVRDHADEFAANPRSSMALRSWERLAPARKRAHVAAAKPWLGRAEA